MALTSSLLKQLEKDYPKLAFKASDVFCWSPSKKTVFYSQLTSSHQKALLLHELAHALLKHRDFDQDIDLLHQERVAWEHAKETLATRYNVKITEEDIETALDSYRDWLHQRSKCPDCASNAPQTKTGTYRCIVCGCQWRANDARLCQLRRYKVSVT